jgi:hypothetical protein
MKIMGTTTFPSRVDGSQRGARLLLVNGILLGLVASGAALSDLAAYFLNAGPMARALYGNLHTIGVLEAHGLALILAVVLLLNHQAHSATYHWIAAGTHLLLGVCNLTFWAIYAQYDLLAVGYGSTAFHATFLILHIAAILARAR